MRPIRFAKWGCLSALFLMMAGCAAPNLFAADRRPPRPPDARALRLDAFLRAHHCPRPLLISEYLDAADAYSLDYRLLPAVSVRESTCGLHARLNNRWGWDSAHTGFESLVKGIRFLAHQLTRGRNYRDKTLDERLRTYNPDPRYSREIRNLMREIDAD